MTLVHLAYYSQALFRQVEKLTKNGTLKKHHSIIYNLYYIIFSDIKT